MKERRIITSLRLNLLIVIFAVFSFINVFYKFINVDNSMVSGNYVDVYLTYTYLSSGLAGLSAFLMIIFELIAIRKNKDVPSFIDTFKYVTTCAITLTFIVTYALLLKESYDEHGLDIIFGINGPLFVHTLIPLLCICTTLFVEPFNKLKKISVLFAAIPPILYLGYTLINKYFFEKESAYFFMNFNSNKLVESIIYIASIAAGYVLLSIVFLIIKNKIYRSVNRGIRSRKELDLNVGKNDKIVSVNQYRESGLKPVDHKDIKIEEKVVDEEQRLKDEKREKENLEYIKSYGLSNAMSSLANKPVEQKNVEEENENNVKEENLEKNIIKETINEVSDDEIETKEDLEDLSVSDKSYFEDNEEDEEDDILNEPIEIDLENKTPKRRVDVSEEKPAAKPVTKPVAKPKSKTTVKPAAKSATKVATKPSNNQTSKPVSTKPSPVKPTPVKPISKVAPKPVAPKPVPVKKKEEPEIDNDYKGKDRVYHIGKQKSGKWQVKLANGEKAIKLFDTQKEAIDFAKELVSSQGGSYRIHSLQGKIRKDS